MSLGAKAKAEIYYTYVLRVWAEADGQWRVVLIDAATNQTRSFASLEALLAFLQADLSGRPPPAAISEALGESQP